MICSFSTNLQRQILSRSEDVTTREVSSTSAAEITRNTGNRNVYHDLDLVPRVSTLFPFQLPFPPSKCYPPGPTKTGDVHRELLLPGRSPVDVGRRTIGTSSSPTSASCAAAWRGSSSRNTPNASRSFRRRAEGGRRWAQMVDGLRAGKERHGKSHRGGVAEGISF